MAKAIWIVTSIVVVLMLMIGGFFLFKQRTTAPNMNKNTSISSNEQEPPVKDFLSSQEILQYSDRIMISRVGQENFMRYFQFRKVELIEPKNKDRYYVIFYT